MDEWIQPKIPSRFPHLDMSAMDVDPTVGDVDDEFEDSDDEIMLNLNKKDTKVWLVKVPKFVAEKWSEQPAGEELGKLRIYKKYIS